MERLDSKRCRAVWNSAVARIAGRVKNPERIKVNFAWRLVVTLWLLVSSAAVVAANYFYDANDRLVAMTNDGGQSARYVYDVMGNIVSVDALGAEDLAIFGFSPGQGGAGDRVSIQGNGFSETLSENVIKFNGIPAVAITASGIELTADVPVGASTGPISITVNGIVVVSEADYIVGQNAMVPVIDSVSPEMVGVGDLITITGRNLYPNLGQTQVYLNGYSVAYEDIDQGHITVRVIAGVGTGRIKISTPYGTTTSSEPIVVLPTGINVGMISELRRISVDAPPEQFQLGEAGKYVAVLFDNAQRDFLSLRIRGLNVTSLEVSLYDTDNAIVFNGFSAVAKPVLNLPYMRLPQPYRLLLLKPSTVPADWGMEMMRDKVLYPDQEAPVFSPGIPGEIFSFKLTLRDRQQLGLGISNFVATGSTWGRVTIQDATRKEVLRTDCVVSQGGCRFDLSGLVAGDYRVLVNSGEFNYPYGFKIWLSNDISGVLARDESIQIGTGGRHGQNARLKFSGMEGEAFAFNVDGLIMEPAGRRLYAQVYKPDGSLLTSTLITGQGTLNIPALPEAGEYSVLLYGEYGSAFAGTMVLATGINARLLADAPSRVYETLPGQIAYFTFTIQPGQRLVLNIDNFVATGISWTRIAVFDSTGKQVKSSDCYISSSNCRLDLSSFATGDYRVLVNSTATNYSYDFSIRLNSETRVTSTRTNPINLGRRECIPRTDMQVNTRVVVSGCELLKVCFVSLFRSKEVFFMEATA
ncbi:MAG: IPT/TIG domain-containing protein [Xanthomonadaceae bacterium]|jgi:YD repeat-containing protein|nr:IPT/TIG domain-containing protein [Xanthomonadaceae bacterium]